MADRIITVTSPSVVTNDTLASYNNYSDVDGSLGSMTPTEATNGKTVTLSDGSVHQVTSKPVGTTNGEFSAVVSNAVTVDLAGSTYEPWNDANCVLALTSDVVLPIDVSLAEDGTGGNPMASQGSDPTNANGWNTFVRANSNYTNLVAIKNIVANENPYTDIVYFTPLVSLDPIGSNAYYLGGASLGDSISLDTSGNLALRISDTGVTVNLTAADVLTVGVPIMFTFTKDASNDVYYQINNETPVLAGNSVTRRMVDAHGARNDGTVFGDVAMGRRLCYDAELTGAALQTAKDWILAGDLT